MGKPVFSFTFPHTSHARTQHQEHANSTRHQESVTMGLQEDFDAAAAQVKTFKKVGQNDQLVLYGLFKQANAGDCEGSRPGMFDPKGRAKYDAWAAKKGVDKDTAMQEYIAKVAELAAAE